jgi:hypothetical protein
MSTRHRMLAGAAALLLAAVPAGALAATAKPPAPKAPKSGKYKGTAGTGHKMLVFVQGKSIALIGFDFSCKGGLKGNTSLSDVKVTKSRNRYGFAIKTHGITSYSDSRGDDNATIDIRGKFAADGKSAAGTLVVTTKRCGKGGSVRWSARR